MVLADDVLQLPGSDGRSKDCSHLEMYFVSNLYLYLIVYEKY